MNSFFDVIQSIWVICFAVENLWFRDHSEQTFITILIMHFRLTMNCCVETILSWEFWVLFWTFLITQMSATVILITCCSWQCLMLVFLIFFCCCERSVLLIIRLWLVLVLISSTILEVMTQLLTCVTCLALLNCFIASVRWYLLSCI